MLKALCILFVGTLLSAALLTPWVCEIIVWFYGELPWPFSRVFDRVAMLCALIFLLILRKHFPLSEVFGALKQEPAAQASRRVGLGVLVTLGSVALTVPLLVHWTDELIWQPKEASVFAAKFLKVFFAGLLIAFIEESFFRVLLLNKLRLHLSTVKAVVVCSVLYAAVHFIAPIKTWKYDLFRWDAGLLYLKQLAAQFFHPTVPASFFGLLLVGLVLCTVMVRYRSLYLCIGLHAGWVMGVKGVKLCGDFNPALGIPSGRISQYFLVSLPLAWCSIALVAVVLWGMRRQMKAL